MFTFEFIVKTIFSALIISVIVYISRKSTIIGGLIASLPLTSILALVWMYHDGSTVQSLIELSNVIFWMVIPSLIFFIAFPSLLKMNVPFYGALFGASGILIIVYVVYTQVLSWFNIKLQKKGPLLIRRTFFNVTKHVLQYLEDISGFFSSFSITNEPTGLKQWYWIQL